MKILRKNRLSGSILVMVLGILMILSVIVTSFLKNLSQEMQLKLQLEGKPDLRHEAYNALEVIRCQLEQLLASNDDPQKAASVQRMRLPSTVKAEVAIIDESGKIPLNHSDEKQLIDLFRLFGDMWEAKALAQEYTKWLKEKPVVCTLIDKNPLAAATSDGGKEKSKKDKEEKKDDEDTSDENENDAEGKKKSDDAGKPTFPKGLNNYLQLAEINKFRALFFDKEGKPNKQLKRLAACTSLYSDWPININAVSRDALAVVGKRVSLDADAILRHLGVGEKNPKEKHRYKSLQEIDALGHGQTGASPEASEGKNKKQDTGKVLTTNPTLLTMRLSLKDGGISFAL
ncbi:MAG: hypothetical protein IJ793_03745, partial [Opitutales bacterium]|nr:hypothetical protein [Opitutales bacterium]